VRFSGAALPESHMNFVLSKWKRSLRHGNDYFKLVRAGDYYDAYDLYLARLLAEDRCAVRLAVLDEDADVILGFSVARANVLDYVYVHKDARGAGIARALIPLGIDTISHLTKTGLMLWSNKFPDWAFNPFA
jgi:GNAT superfamily N-acetyltransferase